MQFAVKDDASEEILTDKWQCEYGFCQRANAMAVMFTHSTSMHEGGDFKAAKKVIDFALNINRVLRLGGDAGMVHLSPFSLYLL